MSGDIKTYQLMSAEPDEAVGGVGIPPQFFTHSQLT